MTNEDIAKLIALLDNARRICNEAQIDVPLFDCDDQEPAKISEASLSPKVFQIYWVGCRGLADLARKIAAYSFNISDFQILSKIGLTEETIERRLSTLGKDKYGSITRIAGKYIVNSGFERWIAQAIHVSRKPKDAAISLTARTIDVTLPHGMTRRQLDLGLRKGLSRYSLDGQGVECFTKYSGLDRMSRATELVIGPNPRDADFLLEIVEKILADHRTRTANAHNVMAPSSKARLFKARAAMTAPARRR